MAQNVELRGRGRIKSGSPTGRLVVAPIINAQGLFTTSAAGGAQLLSFTKEDLDIPENLVLNLSARVVNPPIPALSDVMLRARLTYGYGKSKTEAYVDVKLGAQYNLVASTLAVDIITFSLTGVGPTFEVFGAVSYGEAGRCIPTLTSLVIGVAAAATTTLTLPPRASAITVYSNVTPSIVTVSFSQGGVIIAVGSVVIGTRILIPNGADSVAITNGDAAARTYTLVHELDL
jgi:hypothetical protein